MRLHHQSMLRQVSRDNTPRYLPVACKSVGHFTSFYTASGPDHPSVYQCQPQTDEWMKEYNTVRQHDSLGHQTPARYAA